MDANTETTALHTPDPRAALRYSFRSLRTEDGGEEVDVCESCAAEHMPAVNGHSVVAEKCEPDTLCDYCQPARVYGR